MVRGEREKIQNGQMRDKRLGQECCINRGGPDCTVEVYMSEESEEGESQCYGRGVSSKSKHCQEF